MGTGHPDTPVRNEAAGQGDPFGRISRSFVVYDPAALVSLIPNTPIGGRLSVRR